MTILGTLSNIEMTFSRAMNVFRDDRSTREEMLEALDIAITACDDGKQYLTPQILKNLSSIKQLRDVIKQRVTHD